MYHKYYQWAVTMWYNELRLVIGQVGFYPLQGQVFSPSAIMSRLVLSSTQLSN